MKTKFHACRRILKAELLMKTVKNVVQRRVHRNILQQILTSELLMKTVKNMVQRSVHRNILRGCWRKKTETLSLETNI